MYLPINKIFHVGFIILLLVMFDAVYIYFMKDTFSKLIRSIQGEALVLNQRALIGAVICYILLAFGLYYFAISKTNSSVLDAFLLGLVIYGVFDSTNFLMFKKWDWRVMVIDAIWGGVLFSMVYSVFLKLRNSFPSTINSLK
jgi:uncharacterized membrane protein